MGDLSAEVTSLRVVYNFSEPIAANRPGVTSSAPFVGAFRRTSGAGDFLVTTTYTGLVHSVDGMNFVAGLPATAETVEMNNVVSPWPDGSPSSSYTLDSSVAGADRFQGIHGFDLDGGGLVQGTVGGAVEDMERVYARGMVFDITPVSGSFDSNTLFRFSMNGGQWPQTLDAAAVPEPSGILLGSMGLTLVLLKRRRSEGRTS